MFKNSCRLVFLFLFGLMLASGPAWADVVVQVLSGQDAAAARKEAERLFELGVPAFSRAEQVPNRGVWNRVYIGPFNDENQARATAENLVKQGAIKEFIVKTSTAPPVADILPPPVGVSSSPADIPVTAPGRSSAASDIPVLDSPASGAADIPVISSEGPGVVADIPVIGPEGTGAAADIPVIGPDGNALGGPVTPFELPVADTPTYGEPVSPEQAKALGLNNENQPAAMPTYGDLGQDRTPPGSLPTYGEIESGRSPQPQASKDGLPPGFKVGDDMPGLVLPPPPGGQSAQPATGAPAGQESSAPAPRPAPSAGDDDGSFMVAQAGVRSGSGTQYLSGFALLVDLSSSMRRITNCQGMIKEEAVASLLRKMNRNIPNHPYTASLRVFGYKNAITWRDFTTLYYGPTTYDTDQLEDAIARLAAADAISPFASALKEADGELQSMGSPRAVLMFSDFEETMGSGNPVNAASDLRRRYSNDVAVYTFYITRQNSAAKLAKEVAKAGGGRSYEICQVLNNEVAFENMMVDIFGARAGKACSDQDGDGVCDDDDICPNTPKGAPVDERGCWIAAYSQFFDFDKTIVKREFLPRIQHAADIIKNNPGLPPVLIAGHTDNVGRPEYNMDLGRHRAQSVYNLLVEYGVPKDRLRIESFGETRPVATNDTEEGRARNRRVEFHIGEMPQ